MKAYQLSIENGTIQIGDTVFQPCTKAAFTADRKGLQNCPVVDVPDKSMASANEAIAKFSNMEA